VRSRVRPLEVRKGEGPACLRSKRIFLSQEKGERKKKLAGKTQRKAQVCNREVPHGQTFTKGSEKNWGVILRRNVETWEFTPCLQAVTGKKMF